MVTCQCCSMVRSSVPPPAASIVYAGRLIYLNNSTVQLVVRSCTHFVQSLSCGQTALFQHVMGPLTLYRCQRRDRLGSVHSMLLRKYAVKIQLGTDNWADLSILVKQLSVLEGCWSVIDPAAAESSSSEETTEKGSRKLRSRTETTTPRLWHSS